MNMELAVSLKYYCRFVLVPKLKYLGVIIISINTTLLLQYQLSCIPPFSLHTTSIILCILNWNSSQMFLQIDFSSHSFFLLFIINCLHYVLKQSKQRLVGYCRPPASLQLWAKQPSFPLYAISSPPFSQHHYCKFKKYYYCLYKTW